MRASKHVEPAARGCTTTAAARARAAARHAGDAPANDGLDRERARPRLRHRLRDVAAPSRGHAQPVESGRFALGAVERVEKGSRRFVPPRARGVLDVAGRAHRQQRHLGGRPECPRVGAFGVCVRVRVAAVDGLAHERRADGRGEVGGGQRRARQRARRRADARRAARRRPRRRRLGRFCRRRARAPLVSPARARTPRSTRRAASRPAARGTRRRAARRPARRPRAKPPCTPRAPASPPSTFRARARGAVARRRAPERPRQHRRRLGS